MADASQAVSRRVVSVEGSRRLAEIAPEIERRRATHCVVLKEGVPRGIVRLRELAAASSLRLLSDLAVTCPAVEHDAPLTRVAAAFQEDGIDGVLVLDEGRFAGLITPESFLEQLLEEQNQIAAERERDREALAASERQLRLVTDSAPVFIVQLDGNHRYKFANQAYARRYGREVEDTVGRHVREVLGDDAYEILRPKMDAALAGQEVGFEVELPYAGLGPRWVQFTYVPERLADGTVTGIVAVIRDTTEEKQAEAKLQSAHDQALAASRAKDDFLAALSHELRTPLQPVLLLSSAAAENPSLSPQVREDFAFIRKHVELEARLIDDLLDLTRITQDKLVLRRSPTAFHEVLADALEIVADDVRLKGITLTVQWPPAGLRVSADPVRLQQVYWNVLKNAVKFTPDQGRIDVVAGLSADQRSLVVRVTDSGIGLKASELEHIFNAFAQGDHARPGSHRFGGLGLGLAISRKLMELHGGRIWAESDGPQRGSTFVIELPVLATA
jgi:PAS domain S-box-containing protein